MIPLPWLNKASIFSPGDIPFHDSAASPYENCVNKSCVLWMGEPNTAVAPLGVLTAHVAGVVRTTYIYIMVHTNQVPKLMYQCIRTPCLGRVKYSSLYIINKN